MNIPFTVCLVHSQAHTIFRKENDNFLRHLPGPKEIREWGGGTASVIKSYNSSGQTSGQSYSLISTESSLRGCSYGAFRGSHYCYLIVPPPVMGSSAPWIVGGRSPRPEKSARVFSQGAKNGGHRSGGGLLFLCLFTVVLFFLVLFSLESFLGRENINCFSSLSFTRDEQSNCAFSLCGIHLPSFYSPAIRHLPSLKPLYPSLQCTLPLSPPPNALPAPRTPPHSPCHKACCIQFPARG